MPPRAILFDFDGVIADTENHHVAAWQRTFSDMGWAADDATCARAMELDDREFLAEVFRKRKIERGDVQGWLVRKQNLTRMLLSDSPRVYPGVAELVGRLKGRVPLGVVTSTWRENVVTVLTAAGLREAFDLIVAKEDTTSPKPDPAGYLRAAECLSLPPSDVVALEDSPSGLTAAREAGVRAVAVGHRKVLGPWVGDGAFLADLRDTAKALQLLGFDDHNPG